MFQPHLPAYSRTWLPMHALYNILICMPRQKHILCETKIPDSNKTASSYNSDFPSNLILSQALCSETWCM